MDKDREEERRNPTEEPQAERHTDDKPFPGAPMDDPQTAQTQPEEGRPADRPEEGQSAKDQPAASPAEGPADEIKAGGPSLQQSGGQSAEQAAGENPPHKKQRRMVEWNIGGRSIRMQVRTIVFSSIAAVLAALLCFAFVFSYRVFIRPRSVFDMPTKAVVLTPEPFDDSHLDLEGLEDEQDVTPSPTVAATPTPTVDPVVQLGQQADQSIMNGKVNVVLVGVDHAAERDEWNKYFYSDVMLVLAIDFANNKVDMISIPRDTYSPIYNTKGKYKLNSSFYWGGGKDKQGYEYVCRSIETVLGGVPVPYYIGVDMPAVKVLVDAIGGVDYEVDLPIKIQGRELKPGMQHLNGQQALDYLRARHKTAQPSDLQRVDRQKNLLLETFRQLKSSRKLISVPQLLASLSDQARTNMTYEQLCALAYFGMHLDESNIAMHTMPGKYAYMIYNWNYVILDQPGRVKLIKEVYGVDVPQMKKYSMKYCKLEWATMQANKYLSIVTEQLEKDAKRPVETQKIVDPDLTLLRERMDDLRAAKKSGSYETVNLANTRLKNDADAIFKAANIKVNWFVNENPGLPRLTG